MANITRIKNNQVTDNTIEYQKLKDGTLVGSKFNANLTLNSKVTILGNLTVANSFAQLNSINTYINDPIVVFNNNYTGSPTYDIGMLINRNLDNLAPYGAVNAAFVWKEASNAFEALMTTETGTTAGSINNSGFANITVGNIAANSAIIRDTIESTSKTTGALIVKGGVGITGNINANEAYIGNMLFSRYGGIWNDQTSNPQFIQTSTDSLAHGIGMGTVGGANSAVYSPGGITFGTGVTLRNHLYPTAGVYNVSIDADGNFFAQSGTAATDIYSGALRVTGGAGVTGALFVGGNIVADSGTASSSTTTGALVVDGGVGISGQLNIGGGIGVDGNLAAAGGGLTTSNTAGYLFNENVTTLNIGRTASTIDMGATSGTITINNPTLVGTQTTQDVYNTVATTVNAFGAATSLNVGAATGTLTIANPTITGTNATALNLNGSNPVIATTSTGTASVFNENATTLNIGGDATTVSIGASTGTATINNQDVSVTGNVVIEGNLTVRGTETIINSADLTINDSIINLHTWANLAPLSGDDGRDIGVKFHYYKGGDGHAFVGWANDTGFLEYYAAGAEGPGNTFIGSAYGTIKSGEVLIANSTVASSYTSGALRVTGGAGIAGATFIGGGLQDTVIGNATPNVATITQLNTTGVYYAGGNIVANSGTTSTGIMSGAIVITDVGGLAVGGNIHAGVYDTSLHNIRGNLLLGLGEDQANDSLLTLNLNSTAPLVSNAVVHMSAAVDKPAFIAADSFGTVGLSGIVLRHADGTPSAPTAAQAGSILGQYLARGYGATGYSSAFQSSFQVTANENFTDTAQGTFATVNVVPDGEVSAIRAAVFGGNGTVTIPTTVTSTTPTTGALVVAGGVGITGNLNVGGKFDVGGISLFEQQSTFMGNIVANSSVNSENINTGALVVVGGVGVYSNVFIGGSTTFNANFAAGYDTIVHGNTDSTLLWARAGVDYDQVLIGNAATTADLVRGAKLIINTTDSILLPVGTNAQRPGNAGGTDVTGMFRYNTTANGLEYFNDTEWTGITTQFTVIVDEQFNGDGVTVDFEMLGASTTASSIVSINGVMQIPTLAYSVGGVDNKTLTFTEAPADGDIIDVRRLTTTQTVYALASVNGYMQVVTENESVSVYTGTSGTRATTSWIATGQEIANGANVQVNSANVSTTIDTMDNTKYRSAQHIVQSTYGTKYQVQTVTVIQDGGNVYCSSHGIVQTNGNLGVVNAVINGSNSDLKFISANPDTIIRVSTTYITI